MISVLALTGSGLRIVYIQRRRGSMYRLRSGSELGWAYPLDQLSWIRKCAGKNVEFGFPDGSWTTLVVHTDEELQQYFPSMLPETAGVPW
ncbi:hypothetical protein [Streptomyces marispadix]|uniref:Uncharacterized protein n=1 Tax=Streptomyces marispadix TaxID=2922868 RepID=A0ABS9SW90_9ACTN|nr:hypothetical protein [Streptomyces marispadix]MCH6160548.1 hypothetical protein [Streptomyces marispadix]